MMTIITRGADVETDDMTDPGSLSQTDSNSLAPFYRFGALLVFCVHSLVDSRLDNG